MDIENSKSFNDLRTKTDKSLDAERHKTDTVIDRKSKSIEDESDKKTQLNRNQADLNQVSKRLVDDVQNPEVADERLRADNAQVLARENEDKIRSHERFQKRQIADALLETERRNTDGKLQNERLHVDISNQEKSNLLTEEQKMHDATKTALITRDQFLAIVSHDLKDPLGTIATCASLIHMALDKHSKENAEISQLLEIIELGSANMDRMISDLLDVERMSNNKLDLQLAPVEVCSLLNACVEHFTPIAKTKRVNITVQFCTTPIIVDADYDRIVQVLYNLIGNSIKFSKPGVAILISAIQKKDEVEISVHDDGPGIEENKKANIFERFSQLQLNDRRGLGLGLFISKWIIEAHHGRIWVTSQFGYGCKVHFSLPIHNSKQNEGDDGIESTCS